MFFMGLSQVFTLSVSQKESPSQFQELSNNNKKLFAYKREGGKKRASLPMIQTEAEQLGTN